MTHSDNVEKPVATRLMSPLSTLMRSRVTRVSRALFVVVLLSLLGYRLVGRVLLNLGVGELVQALSGCEGDVTYSASLADWAQVLGTCRGRQSSDSVARSVAYLELSTRWLATDSQAYQHLAEAYALSGNPSQVLDPLSRATVLDPNNVLAQFRLGQWYSAQGEMENALNAWRQAKAAQFFLREGKAFLEKGRLDGAKQLVSLVVSIEPELAEGYRLLGDLQREAGQRSLAAQSYRRASRLTAADTDMHYVLLARAYWLDSDWDRAIESYQRAISLNPAMSVYHFDLANLYLDRGEPEQAIQVLKSGIEQTPDYFLYRLLGDILRQQNRCPEAVYWYEGAIRIDEGQFSPWLGIGLCEYQEGKLEQAIESFRQAETLNPENPDLHYWLGQSSALLGDFQEAEKEFEKAISIAQDYRYHLALGDLYYRMGDAEQALAQYKRVLEIDPANPTVTQRVRELSQ